MFKKDGFISIFILNLINIRYGIENYSWDSIYLSALYFSITTMITIGYGDIHPYTSSEMIF